MQLLVNLFLFFIFLVLNVYIFDVSVNVSPAFSSSISLSGPRKSPSASRISYTKVSYIYVTFDLIRIISILFLWAIHLLPGIICIKVRFINFKSNISVLPKPHATQLLSSQNFQSWLYLYTFLLLFEPILLLFVLDKSITLFFPHIKSLVTINKCFYSNSQIMLLNFQIPYSADIVFCILISVYSIWRSMVSPTCDIFK